MVRLNDHLNMTLDVYCGRKTTIQQQIHKKILYDSSVEPSHLDSSNEGSQHVFVEK